MRYHLNRQEVVITWPTEVAPNLFDSLLLSGARIKETCAKYGIGKPSAYSIQTSDKYRYKIMSKWTEINLIRKQRKDSKTQKHVFTLYISACLSVFGKCSSALEWKWTEQKYDGPSHDNNWHRKPGKCRRKMNYLITCEMAMVASSTVTQKL